MDLPYLLVMLRRADRDAVLPPRRPCHPGGAQRKGEALPGHRHAQLGGTDRLSRCRGGAIAFGSGFSPAVLSPSYYDTVLSGYFLGLGPRCLPSCYGVFSTSQHLRSLFEAPTRSPSSPLLSSMLFQAFGLLFMSRASPPRVLMHVSAISFKEFVVCVSPFSPPSTK